MPNNKIPKFGDKQRNQKPRVVGRVKRAYIQKQNASNMKRISRVQRGR